MDSRPSFGARRCVRLLPLALAAGALPAQIPLGGSLSGTLAPGVYHTTSSLSVASGQTLTLSPGVIVKFTNGGHELAVDGTLVANGTVANPVIFTDVRDDSAGGDTNGDGPSVGVVTSWRGVVFHATATGCVLNHTEARFGGAGFVANFQLDDASPTFVNCASRNNYQHGMRLSGNSRPTVTNCVFTGNSGYAVDGVAIAALPGFSGNTASGNGGNYAHVTGGGVTANLAIGPAAMISGAVVVDTSVSIAQGVTLTLQAGLVVKFANGGDEVTVDGTLLVNGTAGNPVVLTDLRDDSAGGDTNGNGASSGTATAWRGIVFNSTSTGCVLQRADVRYGGAGFVANFQLNAASPTFVNCTSRNNYQHGMQLIGNSRPTVTNCVFSDNGGFAVEGVAIAALPGFSGNTASGNVGGNYARVTDGTVSGSTTVAATAMIGGAVVVDTVLAVAQGATLSFGPGTVVKFRNGGDEVTVDGTLVVAGTAANPVVFTDLRDDSAGGDTNGNGPSTGGWTAWRGIVFNATSTGCVLDHADVRYGGAGFVANFQLNAASPTLIGCTSRDNYTHGLRLSGGSFPTVRDCTFTGNQTYAVEGVSLAAVAGFTNNHAAGNGGNYLHVTDGTIAGTVVIGSQSILEGALIMADNLYVAVGGSLTLQQGVVLKFSNGLQATIDGAVHVLGTSYEPVVFTEIRDDEFGGDTNNNGPSSGTPTGWRGFVANAGATASTVEHALIRYSGAGFVPGLTCASPNVALRAVRVEYAYEKGFDLQDAASARDLVAFACGTGMRLAGGAFAVVHATCAGSTVGIRRETAWTGSVVNSISHGNGTNFDNFGSGAQVQFSCGAFAGSNGNVAVDPLFTDQPNGDLHLAANSPVRGIADLLQAFFTFEDFDQNSRIVDDMLVGIPLPDMGAYERCAWDMTVTGSSRPGTVLDYTVTGPTGASFYLLGFLDGLVPVIPYGFFLGGSSALVISPAPVAVGSTFQLPVPNDSGLAGIQVGIQTLTYINGSITYGNFTRLHRILLRP